MVFHVRTFLVSFIALVLFLNTAPLARAATTCSMQIKGPTDASYVSTGNVTLTKNNDPISIRVSGAVIDDQVVNSPDDAAFYINVTQGPNTGKRYYIPASQFKNGAFEFAVGNDSSGNPLFTASQLHTIQLVRDWGPISNHTVVCNASAKVYVDGAAGANLRCNWQYTPDPNDGESYTLVMRSDRAVGPVSISTRCEGSGCGVGPMGGMFAGADNLSREIVTFTNRTCTGQNVCFNAGESGQAQYYGGINWQLIADTAIANIQRTCGLGGIFSENSYQAGRVVSTIKSDQTGIADSDLDCVESVLANPPVYRATVSSTTIGRLCQADLSISLVNAIKRSSDEDPDAQILDTSPLGTSGEAVSREEVKIDPYNFCNQIPEAQRSDCEACVQSDPGESQKLYTAVGCINTDERGLAENLIGMMLGLGGGVALLSILAAAFYLTTSQGESGKVKEAKELITAAVTGLFFIIFSIFILQFVGVSILRIPGLGGS